MSSYAVRIAELLHLYGHGRAENLAAFGEGLILLLTAAVIAFEAVRRLVGEPVHVDPALYAMALVAATMLLEIGRASTLRWAGRRWHSPALAAAAQNRFADIFSSAGVLAGLVGVRFGLAGPTPARAFCSRPSSAARPACWPGARLTS